MDLPRKDRQVHIVERVDTTKALGEMLHLNRRGQGYLRRRGELVIGDHMASFSREGLFGVPQLMVAPDIGVAVSLCRGGGSTGLFYICRIEDPDWRVLRCRRFH